MCESNLHIVPIKFIFTTVLNLPFFIAGRGIAYKRAGFSSFIIRLAVIATAVSIAVMVLAVAVIQGFKYEIREKLFSFWGHVMVANYSQNASDLTLTEPIRYDSNLVHLIKQLPHVSSVSPFIVRPAIIKTPTDMEGTRLKGIDSTFRFSESISLKGHYLQLPDSGYASQIILSQTTADKLKLKLGDAVQIYFIEKGSTAPRIRKLTVAGIFHSGMEDMDKTYALCDMRLLQRINQWQTDDINGYQITLTDEKYMDNVSDTIFQQYLDAPLYSYTLREVYANIFDWLQLQNINAEIVLIIMAIVATINLAVAILILIVEQARMIGILKSLGMAYGRIMRVFLYYALYIAIAGIVLGNIVAISLCWLQAKKGILKLDEATYYMKQVPVRIHIGDILLIDVATLLFCILFMWLPGLYIKRIQTVKVIQFK